MPKERRSKATSTPEEASPKRRSATSNGAEKEVRLLDSYVGYNLRRAAATQRERFRRVFGPYKIRPVQLSILLLVYHYGPIRQSVLGRALDIKRANVVTLLDELEDRGIVVRRAAEGDRRSRELHLTPSGRKLAGELLELHEKLEADAERTLGGEKRNELLKLLQSFRKIDTAPNLD